MLKTTFRHEWVLLIRNRLQLFILFLFTVAALYAVYYGNAEVSKQQQTIKYIRQQNVIEQKNLVNGFDADTSTAAGMASYETAAYPSKVRFFLNFYAISDPTAFAKLSIGQRDIYPYYLQLNAQNLYLQLFRSEISNPRKLLAGNFDLAFVIIYLLPLLIVAFVYNLLSVEKELGTYAMLKTQPLSMRAIILYKWFFYFVLIASLTVIVSVLGFLWSGIELQLYKGIALWLITSVLYTACWFSLILLINSFNKSSAFNAMWSLGLWLLILIIIPSVLNLAITDRKQVNATQLTDAIRRQQGMSETDSDMKKIVSSFYQKFPEYKADTTSRQNFLPFKAYGAFVTFKDMEAKPKVDKYYQSISERNSLISRFDIISPAVNTQNILNAISKTGMENSIDFTNSIVSFHRQLSRFSFIPLFGDRLMTKKDFRHIPEFKLTEQHKNTGQIVRGLSWLGMLSIIILAIGIYKLNRI